MTDPADLLAAYDEQLRADAETPSAVSVTQHGPLHLVTFRGGRGFVTYRDLEDADGDTIRRLVPEALAHFQADTDILRVEWKTRGHDRAPGLHETLLDHGFAPQEPESIMLGEARLLAVDAPLPEGVTLRIVTTEQDVRAMSAMQGEAFGDPVSEEMANALLHRLSSTTGCSCGSPRPRDKSSARDGWTRWPGRTSPGSGAARPGRRGAAEASTAP